MSHIITRQDLALIRAKAAVLQTELERVEKRVGNPSEEQPEDFELARSLAHKLRNYRTILNLESEITAQGFVAVEKPLSA